MLYIQNNQVNNLYSNNMTSGTTIYFMNIEENTGITLNLTYHNDRYTEYTLTTTAKTNIDYPNGKIYLANERIYNYDIYYTSSGVTNVVETGLLRLSGTTAALKEISRKSQKKMISR